MVQCPFLAITGGDGDHRAFRCEREDLVWTGTADEMHEALEYIRAGTQLCITSEARSGECFLSLVSDTAGIYRLIARSDEDVRQMMRQGELQCARCGKPLNDWPAI